MLLGPSKGLEGRGKACLGINNPIVVSQSVVIRVDNARDTDSYSRKKVVSFIEFVNFVVCFCSNFILIKIDFLKLFMCSSPSMNGEVRYTR